MLHLHHNKQAVHINSDRRDENDDRKKTDMDVTQEKRKEFGKKLLDRIDALLEGAPDTPSDSA